MIRHRIARFAVRLVVIALLYSFVPSENLFAQFDAFGESQFDGQVEPGRTSPPSFASDILPNERRVQVTPRNGSRYQVESFTTESGERVGVITEGVTIWIYNVGGADAIDISTDRLVIWTTDDGFSNMRGNVSQPSDLPLEFYMEGNVVFRTGEQTIVADRMYYNVQTQSGVILDGEMTTPIIGYKGLVRLKAEVIRQLNEFQFQGTNAGVTTSRMGVPRYWLQTGQFNLTNVPKAPGETASGFPLLSTRDGQPKQEFDRLVRSRNNLLFVGSVPVFYWPSLKTNLSDPSYYLSSFSINNDQVFGTQVLTGWNLYQILGIDNPIPNTEWNASIDFLSERGLGLGTDFKYRIKNWLTPPGSLNGRDEMTGVIDIWGINDEGLDNLGRGRRALAPEEDFRGRIFGRHRHNLPYDFQFNAEVGLISDRNFLEQYYERDWDEKKDATTGVELKRTTENRSWSVTGDAQVNDFFTQTEWLPRFDHFWIGESILGDWLTWSEHSSVGYAKLNVADAPLALNELAKFDPLAWEADREGIRAATRHELSVPFHAGPVKMVPYALGEAAHWHEDLNAVDADRLYGQVGVRASMPMWKVDPTIQSEMFNVNGIAHKTIWEAEFLYADASEDITRFPLYDSLDDDSIEFFRRRFFFDTFGGVAGGNVPLKFDERFYALRSNQQGWVTSPSTEIADDLMAFRLSSQNRWQTKRGLPGREHIVDFISLNVQGYIYPDADRDNFGQELGMIQYDFEWHPGDRFTILSDGYADLFSEGLRTIYLGAVVSRPTRSRYSVGLRSIEGPISSQILVSSTSYRLSPKWAVKYGSSYDFGKTGNLGQSGQIVRVGESFLVGLGFRYDSSRDNFGFLFSVEPRFMAGKLSRVGGIPISAVGVDGIE